MKKIIIILLIVLVLIYTSYFILTGFLERYDVCLINYSVSADGSEIKLETSLFSSMGFTRGYKDSGGGEKPHYLTFYSTFGGLHSELGAKNEFVLTLEEDDTEIYFANLGGGYKLVLKKNEETGNWERPN